ncbi:ribonuclease H-like domain-containing protein [Nemania serpens]|nr:ribonuclease H-like domain-containing protein [Nemania serpens]
MVYVMEFYVDGGCRGNGQAWSIGAAACCLTKSHNRGYRYRTTSLPRHPTPTNQRAEIAAIIMALEWALEKYDELDSYPDLDVRIHTDSRYAVGCMDNWIYKWVRNGWVNSAGNEVANRDLIEEASDLDDKVKDLGAVRYIWVPRSENEDADRHCNEELDEME